MVEERLHGAPLLRRYDAADPHRGRDPAGRCLQRLGVDRIEKALRRNLHLLGRAVFEKQSEFIAGIAGDEIRRTDLRHEPADGSGDDFVADVIAIAAVEAGEIIDADEQNGEARRFALASRQQLFDLILEMAAGRSAGQRIAVRLLRAPDAPPRNGR